MIRFRIQNFIFVFRAADQNGGIVVSLPCTAYHMQVLFIAELALLLIYSGFLLFFRRAWKSIAVFDADASRKQILVTVILAARNEEAGIAHCINSILKQTYPAALLEIVVIDDHSTDRTAEIVLGLDANNVKLLSLSDYPGPAASAFKKKAIEIGIQNSLGELIVCTDADCSFDSLWIETIVSFYNATYAKFIVMPVMFTNNKSALNIFQLLDFMSLQGITGAGVNAKMLNMCNGANLAYTREAFTAVGGFGGIDRIASGDDMLLMQKIAARFPQNLHFLKSKNVIVHTAPMQNVYAFFQQRIRWASKSAHYKSLKMLGVLLMVYMVNVLLLMIPFLAIFFRQPLRLGEHQLSLFAGWLALLTLKIVAELFFLYPVAGFFNQKKSLWFFPLAQPFHIAYTVIAGWLGNFSKYNWKGRTVN